MERRGEERSVGGRERGKRVGRVGFAGSPLLIFPVRLAASSFRSWSSFFPPQSHSRCLFPSSPGVPVPAYPAPRHLRPSHSRSLARSLFALLLVNALPPFDSRSVLSLSLFLSLFSICIRRSFFIVPSISLSLSLFPCPAPSLSSNLLLSSSLRYP